MLSGWMATRYPTDGYSLLNEWLSVTQRMACRCPTSGYPLSNDRLAIPSHHACFFSGRGQAGVMRRKFIFADKIIK
jgi:hypothetical protein